MIRQEHSKTIDMIAGLKTHGTLKHSASFFSIQGPNNELIEFYDELSLMCFYSILLVGILLKIPLKAILFPQKPCINVFSEVNFSCSTTLIKGTFGGNFI